MSICCVLGCDVKDSDDTTYFTFPIKPTLRKKWRAVIPTASKLHDDSKVCAHHFRETDYVWARGKLRLKSGVVPSVFGGESEESPLPPAEPDTGQAVGPAPTAVSPPGEPCPAPLTCTPPPLADLCQAEGAENCTIECVPEAILNHESDSHSETELHKEDIENIIANYHIKQNKELAERLKASEELDRQHQNEYLLKDKENSETNAVNNGDKHLPKERSGNFTGILPGNGGKSSAITGNFPGNGGKNPGNGGIIPGNGGKNPGKFSSWKYGRVARVRSRSRSERSSQDSDCVLTEEPRPQFVEISVDKGSKDPADCIMLLESVQVDVDPSALLHDYHPLIAEEPSKAEAISLLTSSDSDDVILQEPHIDTVEVSSSDSESRPLVRLVRAGAGKRPRSRPRPRPRRLYPCFQCEYTTYSKSEYQKHRASHRPAAGGGGGAGGGGPFTCACGVTAPSSAALRRHQMAHITDGCVVIENVKKSKTRKRLKRKRYKCDECSFVASHRRDLREHVDEMH